MPVGVDIIHPKEALSGAEPSHTMRIELGSERACFKSWGFNIVRPKNRAVSHVGSVRK